MPERLECEVGLLQKARYIDTLTFTFYLYVRRCCPSVTVCTLQSVTVRSVFVTFRVDWLIPETVYYMLY